MSWVRLLAYEMFFVANLFLLLSFVFAMVDLTASRFQRMYGVCTRLYFQTRNEFLNDLVKNVPKDVSKDLN